MDRLNYSRNFFPELEHETIKVGITINADGKADLLSRAVFFRSRNVSYYVIGHELTHLLQEITDIPKGERSCDVYTLARRLDFCDEVPNYVEIPKDMVDEDDFIKEHYRRFIHETAKTAVSLRTAGKTRYISWFEKTLREAVDTEDEIPADETPEWVLFNEQKQTVLDEFF